MNKIRFGRIILFCTLLVIFMNACTSHNKIELVEKNNFQVKLKYTVDDVEETYMINNNKYGAAFAVTAKALVDQLNLSSQEDKSGLVLQRQASLGSFSRNKDYSFNQKENYIRIVTSSEELQDDIGDIREIELSLYPPPKDREHQDYAERAKINGYYINLLIETFTPHSSDPVTNALYIFEEAPEDYPDTRTLEWGNVIYAYHYSADYEGVGNCTFTITPKHTPPKEKPDAPAAVRPD